MEDLKLRETNFKWRDRTYIMGILNTTPDSFSDGGQFNTLEKAIQQAHQMAENGADILDIGGQSTRPGAEKISLDVELERTISVIELLRKELNIPISIDTTCAEVAKKAVEAGADLVNDISSGIFDPLMLPTVAKLRVPIILMHSRGNPQTMQQLTDYQDLIFDIQNFFSCQIQEALSVGILKSNLILDPGIGFAKTVSQNLDLLRQLSRFRTFDLPLLIGPSRKSFIGHILQQSDPQKRIFGTAAACCVAIANGANILRVHDVKEMIEVCRVADEVWL